jgi:hypothetical protein
MGRVSVRCYKSGDYTVDVCHGGACLLFLQTAAYFFPESTCCTSQSADVYGEGEMTNFKVGFPYIAIISNVSQLVSGKRRFAVLYLHLPSLCCLGVQWAMYCLILFYHQLLHELRGLRPLPKLLCIKAVVFFTFWCGP